MPRPVRPAPAASIRLAGAGQPAVPVNPAVAARVRQLTAQAGHRRAIAQFRARRAADQQARIDALLLEAIAALASLLGTPSPPGRSRLIGPAAAIPCSGQARDHAQQILPGARHSIREIC